MNFFLLFLILSASVQCNYGEELDKNTQILSKCLSNTNKDQVLSDLEKVSHYANWTVEEVPCFARCIAHEKGWFNIEENKWLKQQIVDDLEPDSYNYCRHELDLPVENACEFAFKGLRCLKQAEIYISDAYSNLLNCASDLDASMEQFHRYADFPEKENIPCLFKCFAEKMNFYGTDYKWNVANMLRAFGPTTIPFNETSECKASQEKIRQTDKCRWMYEEYRCIERLYYNTPSSNGTPQSSTTTEEVPTTNVGAD